MTKTKSLQKELESLIKQAGLSKRLVADRIFMEREDDDDEELMDKFYESFKKQLKRESTKAEILEGYLSIMFEMTEIKKTNLLQPNRIELGAIPSGLSFQLSKLN